MDPSQVNWLAVIVAAVSSFLIGGIWYSPLLFAKPWMELNRLEPDQLSEGLGRVFGGAFVLSLVVATNLAFFLGAESTLAFGAFAGTAAGLGWVAATLATVYLFERRPLKLILIDGGYAVVSYAAMGTLLGAWH